MKLMLMESVTVIKKSLRKTVRNELSRLPVLCCTMGAPSEVQLKISLPLDKTEIPYEVSTGAEVARPFMAEIQVALSKVNGTLRTTVCAKKGDARQNSDSIICIFLYILLYILTNIFSQPLCQRAVKHAKLSTWLVWG